MSDLLGAGSRVDSIARPTEVPVVEFNPEPADEAKYYFLDSHATLQSMIHPSGVRIPFLHKLARVELRDLQRYLDEQIKQNAVPYLRHATEDEIAAYRMRTNPKAYIREQVMAEVDTDPEIKARALEDARMQILAELEASGEEIPEQLRKIIAKDERGGRPEHANTGGHGGEGTVAHTQSAASALQRLKAGGATVTLTPASTETIKDMAGN